MRNYLIKAEELLEYPTINIINSWENPGFGIEFAGEEEDLESCFGNAKAKISGARILQRKIRKSDGVVSIDGKVVAISEAKTKKTGGDGLKNRLKVLTQIFGTISRLYKYMKDIPFKSLLLETGRYVAYVPWNIVKSIYSQFKKLYAKYSCSPSQIWSKCPEIKAFMLEQQISFRSWKVEEINYNDFIFKAFNAA